MAVARRRKWNSRPVGAVASALGAAALGKQVYDHFGNPGLRQYFSPSKRPGMKARLPPRKGRKIGKTVPSNPFRLNMGRNLGGKYYKRFGRAKRRRYDKSFNKHGVVYKQENGSVEATTISNSVYIGHGVAPETVYRNVMRCLVKKLFALKGIFIENFDDVVSDFIWRSGSTEIEYRIGYVYRTTTDSSAAASINQYSFVISSGGTPTTTTWNDMVSGLISDIQTNIPDVSANYGELHFQRFFLQTYDGTDVSTDCTLDVEYLKFDIEVVSHLSLQNRTNDAAGSTSILTTSNNPIIGKQYDSYGQWLNGFDLTKTQSGAQGTFFDALYTNSSIGIIATNSSDTYPQILKKPPQGWQLGVNKVSSVMIQPGGVRDHRLRWKATISFNAIIQKLQKFVGQSIPLVPRRTELGFCTMFGLECMLNDRTEVTELQVAWELNQTYMVKCYVGKPPTVPMIVVN